MHEFLQLVAWRLLVLSSSVYLLKTFLGGSNELQCSYCLMAMSSCPMQNVLQLNLTYVLIKREERE